jgi:hypothetical protein
MTALQALHQPGVDLATRRTAAILRGMTAAEAIRLTKGEENQNATSSTAADGQGSTGDSSKTAEGLKSRATPVREQPSTTTDAGSTGSTSSSTNARLLDYLLGNGT